ncbi:MAG: aldo/keto reductase [Candidatus Lindowbacteria bacterium RIFCSPLOWO2_12_FULL_62_27]|nr:MAG: aldo/keto reductase [Candidatus Lindowbacteria bacterium RIFCSPLOWO2_12_FULL_62_27]OGH62954.1 MAG: aldo/keto reductase [Candidatus Lindowbacteria bacterium RIFCSPLOWO2_02_FULL_62_12]
MNYRKFGDTGAQVSEIGFGCWGIGGGWWGKRNDGESRAALDTAVDLGYNFFDTALVYGENDNHSEKLVGEMVRRHRGKELLIATKIPPKNFVWPARRDVPLDEAFPPAYIRECTELSLRNMGIDCLFLQQFHVFAECWVEQDAWVEEFEKLRKEGKIRHWGVSINNHEPASVLELTRRKMVHSLQVIYNIFDQSPEDDLLPLCLKHGVAFIVRVPFDEGGLTGTLTPDTEFAEGEFRARYFREGRLKETVDRAEKIQNDLPAGTAVWQAALQYVLADPAVSTVIPGMRRVENVRKNASVSGRLLPPDTIRNLKKHRWVRDFYL